MEAMSNLTANLPTVRVDPEDLERYRRTLEDEGTKETDDVRAYIRRRGRRGPRRKTSGGLAQK